MDLRHTPEDERFREELRRWLDETIPRQGESPPPEAGYKAQREYDARWQRRLFDAGYAGLHWPSEYGGRDASLAQQLIFAEECARTQAPFNPTNFVGLLHAGPTLMVEGTPEQKAAHLPPILRGEQTWCQCFSEPSAGSDLANLRTSAVRDGDDYVVNGHKIWTSMATMADYAELLVRTDPRASKHRGLSWLILPMDAPGIEIRRIKTLAGSLEFCEVFLEDVRVPANHLVGAENDGWRVSNVTLRFERGTAFARQIYSMQQLLHSMLLAARRVERGGRPAADDAGLRRRIGRLQAELDALRSMLRLSLSQAARTGVPGLGASALKLKYSELWQRAAEAARELIGRGVLARDDVADLPTRQFGWAALGSLQSTISAGTSQIQRNIIAERILGQPKDR